MGFRLRRSINLGLGFRVNLSKTGVGYSWGVKGYRLTKTATGRTRTTASIPGTGMAWVEESSGSRKRREADNKLTPNHSGSASDSSHLYTIENADATELVPAQLQDFVGAIKRYRLVSRLISWSLFFVLSSWIVALVLEKDGISIALFLLFPILVLTRIIYKFIAKIHVQYEYDEYGENRIDLINQLIVILRANTILWQVSDVFRTTQKRTNAGAATSVAKHKISIKKKKPPFLRTNAICYRINLKKEQLYVLPDKILVLSGRKVGAIDIADLNITVGSVRFVENTAPKDAQIVDYTWQYVNKNGTPDKRFKDNRQLPVCLYGTLSLKTEHGFNTLLYSSNVKKAEEFLHILQENSKNK